MHKRDGKKNPSVHQAWFFFPERSPLSQREVRNPARPRVGREKMKKKKSRSWVGMTASNRQTSGEGYIRIDAFAGGGFGLEDFYPMRALARAQRRRRLASAVPPRDTLYHILYPSRNPKKCFFFVSFAPSRPTPFSPSPSQKAKPRKSSP